MSFNALAMAKFGIGFNALYAASMGFLADGSTSPPEPPQISSGGGLGKARRKHRPALSNVTTNYNNDIIAFVMSTVLSGVLDNE